MKNFNNYKGIKADKLNSLTIKLANENGIEILNKKKDKQSIINEYERINLLIADKNGIPMEQAAFLSKKDARKAISQANKETKSISGLIRILKEFKAEYQAGLSAFNIDIDTLTPKIIKSLWKKDYIKDGILIEDYRKKNPLYSEVDDLEAQKKGIKYLIPTHVADTRPVESFTVNKLIKYCAK